MKILKTVVNNLIKKDIFINTILSLLLLITAVATFVPFSPKMPAEGLDASWQFAINQAFSQGLSFGTEFIFTFGPYASAYTKVYHPSTDLMAMVASFYLSLAYWIALVILLSGTTFRRGVFLSILLTLSLVLISTDALFFSYPLLVALCVFKITQSKNDLLSVGKHVLPAVAVLFSPLGFLLLVKGSVGLLCIAITVICFLMFIYNKKKVLAVICLISPITTMVLFWLVSGQMLINLPKYFMALLPIISGYTEAMSIDGFLHEVLFYLLISFFLLLSIVKEKNINGLSKLFFLLVIAVCLFLSFKAGFVRHDAHATISANFLFQTSLFFLVIASTEKWSIKTPLIILSASAVFFALTTFTYSNTNDVKDKLIEKGVGVATLKHLSAYGKVVKIYQTLGFKNIINILSANAGGDSIYELAWHGIEKRLQNKNSLEAEYNVALSNIKANANFPQLQGTTDIYSYSQADLIASGCVWNPRPIFQSYSAYTPVLSDINKAHLLGAQAPDNIIFRVEPIDGRFPSIEDGSSWPVILYNYHISSTKNDYLFLFRNKDVNQDSTSQVISTKRYSLGSVVHLPETEQLVLAEMQIKPTVLGRLANVLFKSSQLQMKVELESGDQRQYRMSANMAKSGFIISPLVENTVEFSKLFESSSSLIDKKVKSFSIVPLSGKSILWSNEYTVTFKKVTQR